MKEENKGLKSKKLLEEKEEMLNLAKRAGVMAALKNSSSKLLRDPDYLDALVEINPRQFIYSVYEFPNSRRAINRDSSSCVKAIENCPDEFDIIYDFYCGIESMPLMKIRHPEIFKACKEKLNKISNTLSNQREAREIKEYFEKQEQLEKSEIENLNSQSAKNSHSDKDENLSRQPGDE